MKRLAVIVVAAALVGGIAGGAIEAALGDSSTSSESTPAPPPTTSSAATTAQGSRVLTPEAIYRDDAPGVVVITATDTETIPATLFAPASKQQVRSLGSGFVIDTKGDIVTNDHVVQGASALRVGFSGGATYPATVVGKDPSTDLAVIRVRAPETALHPLSFDPSSTIQVGDPVYAIGNPFGLDRTLTTGVASATGRDIQAPNGLAIDHAIQTDAAINHGNSGGPLLDRFGRVIGISSQIESGAVDGNVGVGFAVPSDTARAILPQLLSRGHAEHAWLGVSVETIDPGIAGTLKGVPAQGVLVVRVLKGGPAADAGLRGGTGTVTVNGESAVVGGDVIVSIDGERIASAGALENAVAAHHPGERLELGIVRDGHAETIAVTLGNAPGSA